MPQRPASIVFIVVGTMAAVVLAYTATLFILSVWTNDAALQLKALESFKDFGVYAAGVVSGCLIRTSAGGEATKVEVTNSNRNPVPTDPQP